MKLLTQVFTNTIQWYLDKMKERIEFEIVECLDLARHSDFSLVNQTIEVIRSHGWHYAVIQKIENDAPPGIRLERIGFGDSNICD